MKKLRIIACAIFVVVTMAAGAFAYRLPGEFASDSAGRPSTNFAPTVCTVVSLAHKGIYNLPITNVSAFKFWFTKASDDTSLLGLFTLSALSAWRDAGTLKSSGDTFTVGKGIKTIGFANISSATPTPTKLNICYQ